MSIMKYTAYLKTVELKSLTKAAEALGYTQPGISHMITSLEKELGFPLLIRTKEGVYPTEDAKQLLYCMQQIVNSENTLRDLSNQILGIETGSLRVGVFCSTSTQWMPTLLHQFTALHPNIDIQIFEGVSQELCQLLADNKIDLALMSAPAPEGFEFIPLLQDPVLAVLPASHPLASCDKVDPHELIKYPFIIPNEGADEDVWRVLNPEKLVPNIRYRVKGDTTTLAMIANGLGVTLIPQLAVLFPYGNITKKYLTKNYTRTLGIAIRSSKYASPAVKKFLSLTRQIISSGDYMNQPGINPL